MLDRNTIIALVIIGLIFILLPKYYKWLSPPEEPPTETVQTTIPPDTAVVHPDLKSDTVKSEIIPEARIDSLYDKETADTMFAAPDQLHGAPGEYDKSMARVETPLFNMTVGSDGLVTGYELEKYKLTTGGQVLLHEPPKGPNPAIGYLDFDLGNTNIGSFKNLKFTPSTTRLDVRQHGIDSLVLEAGNPSSQYVRLTYIFDMKRYGFTLALQTEGFDAPETREFDVKWKGGVPSTEPDAQSDHTFSGAYAMIGDELEEISLGRDKEAKFNATGQTGFVAVRSKYFMAAIIPQTPGAGADLNGANHDPKDPASPQLYNATLRETWNGQNAGGRWQVYWGPIKLENLKAYHVGLEGTMNWGWAIIKPFSHAMLWLLITMHKYISNYGIVVIIFSILIKVVLWPLTRKSQISMKKMSALQPEVKRLKEFHAKNPQAANKAMMDLYKERGVNPAAGCIPILFQMPLLYGFFIIFRSTIEFRQAPFVGWITDLSQPDVIAHLGFSIPLYGSAVALLPLVMGVSQFFMSKRTMTDPNQKAMIYVMPVFMTLLFNRFPSGLTLYYTLYNLFTIFEQRLIKLPDFTVPEAPTVESNDKKKNAPKTAPSAPQLPGKKSGKKGKK